jgi:hypothetical protein
MTTKVTVDAHAGWDVEVAVQELNVEGIIVSTTFDLVHKNTAKDFYIHSHKQLGSVKEMKNE